MIANDRLELHLLKEAALRAVAYGERDGQHWHEDFPLADDQDAAQMTLRHGDALFGCYAIIARQPPGQTRVSTNGRTLARRRRGIAARPTRIGECRVFALAKWRGPGLAHTSGTSEAVMCAARGHLGHGQRITHVRMRHVTWC